MSRQTKTVTLQAVKDAVDSLLKSGFPLTNKNVREQIGGGSFDNIGPLLAQVKKARATDALQASIAERATVPPDLIERISKVATTIGVEVYESLSKTLAADVQEAQLMIESHKLALQGEIDRALASAEESALRVKEIEEQLVLARERVAVVEAQHAAAVEMITLEQQKHTSELESIQRDRVSEAQRHAAELDRMQSLAAAGQSALNSAHLRIDELSGEAGELRGRLAVALRVSKSG